MHFHAGICTRDGIPGFRQKNAIQSPNKRSPHRGPMVPHWRFTAVKIHNNVGVAAPFRRHRTGPLPPSLAFFSGIPHHIHRPLFYFESEATRLPLAPGVMRFYESQSGLRALDLLRSAFLFVFQRQWLPHEYPRGFKK